MPTTVACSPLLQSTALQGNGSRIQDRLLKGVLMRRDPEGSSGPGVADHVTTAATAPRGADVGLAQLDDDPLRTVGRFWDMRGGRVRLDS